MKVGKNVIFQGRVSLAEDAVIGDNVIIGSSDDGEVVVGDGALIRSGSIIYSSVRIGRNFQTGHNVLVREKTDIGDGVLIGTNSVVDGNCVIGNGAKVQTNVYVTAFTVLGDGVFMGPCSVTTNDKYMLYGQGSLQGPTIKRGARIGANAVILPGVVVGEDAVVGSGSVVTRDVAPGATVYGNPAKRKTRSGRYQSPVQTEAKSNPVPRRKS